MEREPLSASGLVDILSAKPTLSADWNTFSLLAADTPLHAAASFAETALGLYVSGRHRIRRELGRRSVEGWSDPGAINLSPPGLEAKWEASASSRAAVLFVPQAFLARVISEHWEADPRNPALTIDEIGEKTGFSSSTHLATVFKRQLGCSPTAFRRLHASWR